MLKDALKRRLLPRGEAIRSLPLGIGRGLRMGIDFHRGETQLYLGLYEVELNRSLRRLCQPGSRAFDLGGHFGYDALVIAKLTGGPVLSVESEPAYAEAIARNADGNPGLDIEVVVGFVSDLARPGHVTVDDLAASHWVPDFIKIDIEGAEGDALRGSQAVLSDRKPHLLVEVHGQEAEDDCLVQLGAAGYRPTIIDRRRWLKEHRPMDHNRWLVCPGREPA